MRAEVADMVVSPEIADEMADILEEERREVRYEDSVVMEHIIKMGSVEPLAPKDSGVCVGPCC